MKTIQYECRPGQIRSRVYDVILFYNDENWDVIKNTFSLHYDPQFWEYNKYVFFPVQRDKWDGATDAPQNLRTLVASADVLLRAMPSSSDNDLFIAGFFGMKLYAIIPASRFAAKLLTERCLVWSI